MKALFLLLGVGASVAMAAVYPIGPNGPKKMSDSTSITLATDQTALPVAITSYPVTVLVNPSPLPVAGAVVTTPDSMTQVTSYPPIPAGSAHIGSVGIDGPVTMPSPVFVSGGVQVTNFPSPVPVAGHVITDPASMTQVTSYPPIPAGSAHIGSVNVDNFPSPVPVAGHVAVDSLPSPVPVAGGITTLPDSMVQVTSYPPVPAGSAHIGSVNVDNFPSPVPVVGHVAVDSLPSPVPVAGGVITLPASMVQVTSYPPLPTGSAHVGSVTVDAMPSPVYVAGTVDQGAPGATSWPVNDVLTHGFLSSLWQTVQAIYQRLLGHTVADTARLDYSITNVTSGAWVQVIATTPEDAESIEIFDSSGQTLELGVGSVGSENRLILITPGGNGQVPIHISATNRLSVRAVSGTANAGELDVNLYH